MKNEPISQLDLTKSKHQKIGLAIAIFCFFAGTGTTYLAVFRPMHKMHQSKKWVKTDCVIESEEVERVTLHSDSGTWDYRKKILYNYEYNGKMYKSSRYSYRPRPYVLPTVKLRSPGTKKKCYVNPDNPTEAVLKRVKFKWKVSMAIPVIFMVLGMLALAKVIYHMIVYKST